MNKRILELRTQAAAWVAENHQPQDPNAYSQKEIDQRYLMYEERFAELIVGECAGLCSQAAEENARTFYTVSETKEVGPALVAKGSQVQAEKLAKQIKQHFGIEE